MEAEIILQLEYLEKLRLTNMAGRGTDIKLGNNNIELKKEAIDAGGLLVIGTERQKERM